MKKIIFSLSILGLVSLSSCKKDYTCNCTIETLQTMTDENGEPLGDPQTSQTTSSTDIRDKEDDARVQCEGSNGTTVQNVQNGGMTVTQEVKTNCTLK